MDAEKEFERLVDLHYSSLYRFAFSLTRSESDACDLTQETFYIWARKGHQVRDPSKIKSWLFTTLHRGHLQKLRRLSRFPQLDLDHAGPDLPTLPPPGPARLDRDAILGALARLDPRFQAAVALFYLEDHSYPEIAAILEIPLGTVKSRIARGIAQLQSLLREPSPEVSRG